MKKNTDEIACPHCGECINPGSLLAKIGVKKRKVGPNHYSDLAKKRWAKAKAKK